MGGRPTGEREAPKDGGCPERRAFLAQSGRLDIPHTVEHGEQSAVFQNPGPVISRR
jgi:hypothetical protein